MTKWGNLDKKIVHLDNIDFIFIQFHGVNEACIARRIVKISQRWFLLESQHETSNSYEWNSVSGSYVAPHTIRWCNTLNALASSILMWKKSENKKFSSSKVSFIPQVNWKEKKSWCLYYGRCCYCTSDEIPLNYVCRCELKKYIWRICNANSTMIIKLNG